MQLAYVMIQFQYKIQVKFLLLAYRLDIIFTKLKFNRKTNQYNIQYYTREVI